MIFPVLLVYVVSVALFCVVFYLVKLKDSCVAAMGVVGDAAKIILSRQAGDDLKEQVSRDAAIKTLRHFLLILLKSVLCFVGAFAPVFLADYMGFLGFEESKDFAMRVDVIALTLLFFCMVFFYLKKKI